MWGQGTAQLCHQASVGLSCWALGWPAWGCPIPTSPGDVRFPATAENLCLWAGGFLLNYFKLEKKKENLITKYGALGLWVATIGQGDGTCPSPRVMGLLVDVGAGVRSRCWGACGCLHVGLSPSGLV